MTENTPPAVPEGTSDVREARAWIENLLSGNGFGADYSAQELDAWATELLAGFHPRGPVPAEQISDAAVEAAYQALRHNWRITREDARTALEAAREVHP